MVTEQTHFKRQHIVSGYKVEQLLVPVLKYKNIRFIKTVEMIKKAV